MNEHDTTSIHVSGAPAAAGDIPGIARVENLTAPSPEPGTPASKIPSNTLLGDFVGGLLAMVARILSPTLVETTLTLAKKAGHFAVLAGGALTVAYAIFGAIKFNSFAIFAVGSGLVVALAVAQFVAIRFLGAADTIIANTPSRISSPAFLECVGLLVLMAAAATLLAGVAGAIAAQSVMPLLPSVLFGVALTCFGAIALHPSVVNVSTGEGTAGEEAIGLLSFFFKTGLKLAPLFFCLLAVAGGLTILMGFFGSGGGFAHMVQGFVNVLPLPFQIPVGLSGSALVLAACLVPIMSYFVFLIQYLVVDVLRAVLCVPAKLDALKR